jgi:hypothetical protein
MRGDTIAAAAAADRSIGHTLESVESERGVVHQHWSTHRLTGHAALLCGHLFRLS